MCIFCNIVNNKAPATVVQTWDDAIAIVPLNPVVDGHVLVIPRQHVKDALEKPEITARVMQRASELASGQCNIITSVGRDATQSVFHLHLHIVPRQKDDGLTLPWTNLVKKNYVYCNSEIFQDFAYFRQTIIEVQGVLAKYLPPDGISREEAIQKILGILDGQEFLKMQEDYNNWRRYVTK